LTNATKGGIVSGGSSALEQDFEQSDEMMEAESYEATDNLADVEEGLPIEPMTTIMDEAAPVTLGSE
jgi:hypothetical protein